MRLKTYSPNHKTLHYIGFSDIQPCGEEQSQIPSTTRANMDCTVCTVNYRFCNRYIKSHITISSIFNFLQEIVFYIIRLFNDTLIENLLDE